MFSNDVKQEFWLTEILVKMAEYMILRLLNYSYLFCFNNVALLRPASTRQRHRR